MNKLFFGNNVPVLHEHVRDESVDLVYLDPPFNSKAEYNVLYETPANLKETAQRTAFNDNWHWEDEANACFEFVLAHGGPAASILNALKGALGTSDTMAYLAQMAARLIEIRRTMKPTASLYLHCDPTASHYLKIILDAIFGPRNFKNEVIWKRTGAHGRAKKWGPIHDVIFFYTKSKRHTWNRTYEQYDPAYIASHYKKRDTMGYFQDVSLTGPGRNKGGSGEPWRAIDPILKGRHWELPPDRSLPTWFVHPTGYPAMTVQERLDVLDEAGLIYWPPKGKVPRFKRYAGVTEGNAIQDIINDIPPVNSGSNERLGFPTQKPVPLLRRIIEASSNPGDVVLDPFCGCGTTVHAAAQLKRQWIGIDVSYYAIRVIERRVALNFGASYPIKIDGIPADLASAEALAETAPYGFQQWAVSELGCQVWNDGKKGADGGIDGEMWFFAGPGAPGRLLVQVKGGKKTSVGAVREFRRVVEREKATMGVFVTRGPPTPEMRQEASEAGVFHIGSATYSKIALVWMEAWFSGQRPRLPTPIPVRIPQDRTGPKPSKRPDAKQGEFKFVFDGGELEPQEGQLLNPALLPDEVLKTA